MRQTQLYSIAKIRTLILAAGILILAAGSMRSQPKRPLDASVHITNSVDLCSLDSTFIVTVDVGPLFVADSVLLYDISLSFPSDRMRYKSVLFQGTLSENLETKDYNARDSGRIRVYGFNVMKPIAGDKPLFAVLFQYKGECSDSSVIGFGSLPDINAEAKVYYRTLTAAKVDLKIADAPSRSLKLNFSNDTLVFTQGQSRLASSVRVTIADNARLHNVVIGVQRPPSSFTIDSLASIRSTDTLEIDSINSLMRVSVKSKTGQYLQNDCGFTFQIHSNSADSAVASIQTLLLGKDTCACVTRWLGDSTTLVRKANATSSVDEDVEHRPQVYRNGDVWELKVPKNFSGILRLYDCRGLLVYQHRVDYEDHLAIGRSMFSVGVYVATFTDDRGNTHYTMIFN